MQTATLSVNGLPSMEQAYQDVKLLMYRIAHNFSRTYDIPFDELRSEADAEFVRKYPRYNPNRGAKFSSFIYFEVFTHLQNVMAKRKRRQHVEGVSLNATVGADDDSTELIDFMHDVRPEVQAPFEFMEHLATVLSPEAMEVVQLTLETPGELGCMMKLNGVSNWVGFQKTLREHLIELGWTRERIAETFSEISSCLAHR